MWNSRASRGLRCSPSFTTRVTLGITSPPRSTITQSPMRTPSRSTSSWLCSVARETVVPPMNTGFSTATGVSFPVRPTFTRMSSTCVTAARAANL